MKIIKLYGDIDCIVDDDDFEKLSNFRWRLSGKYARSKINGKQILMHRFILNPPKDKQIDHINMNCLDNRKCNLRICTSSQNISNRNKLKNNTTGFKNVKIRRGLIFDSFYVVIMKDRKFYSGGSFRRLSEAVKSANDLGEKLHGEFYKKDDLPTEKDVLMPTKNQKNISRSGYIGVIRHRSNWLSYIDQKGKRIYLGYFDSEKEAAIARDIKAKELRGELAILNFPGSQF